NPWIDPCCSDSHRRPEAGATQPEPCLVDPRVGGEPGEGVLHVPDLLSGDEPPTRHPLALTKPPKVEVQRGEASGNQAFGLLGQPHLFGEAHACTEHHRWSWFGGAIRSPHVTHAPR